MGTTYRKRCVVRRLSHGRRRHPQPLAALLLVVTTVHLLLLLLLRFGVLAVFLVGADASSILERLLLGIVLLLRTTTDGRCRINYGSRRCRTICVARGVAMRSTITVGIVVVVVVAYVVVVIMVEQHLVVLLLLLVVLVVVLQQQ